MKKLFLNSKLHISLGFCLALSILQAILVSHLDKYSHLQPAPTLLISSLQVANFTNIVLLILLFIYITFKIVVPTLKKDSDVTVS